MLSVAIDEFPEACQENENVCVDDIDPNIQSSGSLDPVDTSISGKKSVFSLLG